MPPIYLDNNATTSLDPRVASVVNELMNERLANPASQHAFGRTARRVLESAREEILELAGARTRGMASDHLLFTSGGTESNNLAIFGLAQQRPGTIVVSSIEHPSVLAAAQFLEQQGREVIYLPCDSSGVIQIAPLTERIHNAPDSIALVSVMLANNETGVLQPIHQITHLCRPHAIPVHCDAVQAIGKIPLSFRELDVDAMTITAHKLHGPVGVGALLLRHSVTISPHHFGGFQHLGLRPGTESPVLAAAFAASVSIALTELSETNARMTRMRQRLEQSLTADLPNATILGIVSQRLPHTTSVAFPGIDRQALQLALDHAGIACSTGSACASGSSQPSHVLQAMGLPSDVIRGAVRFSLSRETTDEEIESAIAIITQVVRRLAPRDS
ncbi:MAG: cysteine desulfurase family protein [Pirellula sp.]